MTTPFHLVFLDVETETTISTCRKRMKGSNRFAIYGQNVMPKLRENLPQARTLLLETITQSYSTYRAKNNFEIISGRRQLRFGTTGAVHWSHLRLPPAGT